MALSEKLRRLLGLSAQRDETKEAVKAARHEAARAAREAARVARAARKKPKKRGGLVAKAEELEEEGESVFPEELR